MTKEASYTAILEAHSDRIYRMCCCYVRDADLRMDAYQQVLMHLWQNLDSFEGRSLVGTWVYRITINTCLGLLRKEQRRQKLFLPGGEFRADLLAAGQAGERDGNQDDDLRLLYECINELPALDRTLISLYLEDLSTKEMAVVLEISEANVRVKVHRIKANLKQAMERKSRGRG